MTQHHEWPLAAYLAAELTPHEADLVDQHVMSCDQCWGEVQLARAGQAAAINSAEPAPESLRRRLNKVFADLDDPDQPMPEPEPSALVRGARRALRTGQDGAGRDGTSRDGTSRDGTSRDGTSRDGTSRGETGRVARVLAAAAALVVVAATAAVLGARAQHAADRKASASYSATGRVLDQALAYYRATMLPGGASILSRPAPDLTALGLHVTAAGAGPLGDQPSVGYAYTDAQRDVIIVFTSTDRFRDPALPTSSTATLQAAGGITVFTATNHPMIVIGSNAQLVQQVGQRLS